MTAYTFGLSHPIIFFVFTHFLAKRFYPKETLYLCLLLCNWLSIPLEFLLAFVSLAMIVFVTRTIFVFVGKLLSTYATIVCRYICAFCNDCICFQNNLCICACWQVVGCHSDRSDGTLAYSTRLPSLLVAHLQKPIARRTSTNICNGIRDICNGHAKMFTTNKHKLWLSKAAAGVIMHFGIVFKYYEIIVTIICHHEIVTELIVAWSGRPPGVCYCIYAFC